MVSRPLPFTTQEAQTDEGLDDILSRSLDGLSSSESYTILFVGTPGEQIYEPEFDDRLRMDLKRDLRSSPMRRADNETERDRRPLFEKYQFFTPGKHPLLTLPWRGNHPLTLL